MSAMRLAGARITRRPGAYLTAALACLAACFCAGCTGAATSAAGSAPAGTPAPATVAALAAVVRVGEAPVGLAAVRGGSLVVVADSNRFGARGATSDLDVVNVAAALAGHPAVVGHIRAGLFPRDMTLAPDGTLLVSNFDSGQVEAVGVATIPGAPGVAG